MPDFGSTPVDHSGFFPAPTVPNPPSGVSGVPPMAPVEILPWWLVEFQSAQDWNCGALAAAIAASKITVLPASFSYTVPANYAAVIKSLAVTVTAPTTSMNLTLTLLKGNGPIQGWTNRIIPPGSGASLSITYNQMSIRMQQNETLTAQFTEGGGATWTVTVEASGWQVPVRDILRVQQGVLY